MPIENAGVAELADAMDSKSIGGNPVEVQVLSPVLFLSDDKAVLRRKKPTQNGLLFCRLRGSKIGLTLL